MVVENKHLGVRKGSWVGLQLYQWTMVGAEFETSNTMTGGLSLVLSHCLIVSLSYKSCTVVWVGVGVWLPHGKSKSKNPKTKRKNPKVEEGFTSVLSFIYHLHLMLDSFSKFSCADINHIQAR